MEVGEPLEPGAVLLPRVPDKCLADPLQDLLPVQNHLDHLVTLTLSSELSPSHSLTMLREVETGY